MRIDKVLRDDLAQIAVSEWELGPIEAELGGHSYTVHLRKRTLRGGRQEGVEIVEVNNGVMRFTIVPTRGFTIWTAKVGDCRLGWDSPVGEIVHPRFINLSEDGGLGWLKGFGAWIDRCGLQSIGPPCIDRGSALTLHGRISYVPARFVDFCYQTEPVPRIVLRGIVEEHLPSGAVLRLAAEVSTEIGRPTVTLRDTVTNCGDSTEEWQTLYHINCGPPLLGSGSKLIASTRNLMPRDPRAAEGNMAVWNSFEGPHGDGYSEQVFLMELNRDAVGRTKVMLQDSGRARALSLSFNVKELPYFVLWKNEASTRKGYVAGLEPATSYPYPRTRERAAGRVPALGPSESHSMEISVEILTTEESVAAAEEEIVHLDRVSEPCRTANQEEVD